MHPESVCVCMFGLSIGYSFSWFNATLSTVVRSKEIPFIFQFKSWEVGLEHGQFTEKGLRQRFLFVPYVKEHIGVYKNLKHSCSASLANLERSWGTACRVTVSGRHCHKKGLICLLETVLNTYHIHNES